MGDNMESGEGLAEHIAFQTSAFIQSDEHRDLLDIVDNLRSQGVSHYVDLPQIIVCGSQSSGKSSTLQSLSGIEFPTSEGLCTRFATELVLRRGDKPGLKVNIQPGVGRTEAERIRLCAFSMETTETSDFPDIIEAAKDVMGLSGDGPAAKIFSTDILRIENTSPAAPNLTIVDLPGLFGAADKNQSDDDAALVQELVVSYMRQRRSIILAVVTADNPFANQPVTKFARDIDPHGKRTLGLITKPDKIDKGSEAERYYVELAQNRNVKLSLGWHVLRNRGHTTKEDTIEERDEREAAFFEHSVWGESLDPSQLGVHALKERLADVLWHQIKEGLPGVKSDVQTGIKDCESKLRQLGKARTTLREKHSYLHRISSRLSTLVRAAIDGVYADHFFECSPDSFSPSAFNRRLRAHVQLTLDNYADAMRTLGHALEIFEEDMGIYSTRKDSKSGRWITRAEYLAKVQTSMINCRGRELPGTFNPLVVGDLFSQQCKPWENITLDMVQTVHEAAAEAFKEMVSTICDTNTTTRLTTHRIQPTLHRLRKNLKAKVDDLLVPHLSIHPITYDDYLTESVSEIQRNRHNLKFDKVSLEYCGHSVESADEAAAVDNGKYPRVNLQELLKTLRDATEPDVEQDSASLAADVAAAYYKVALKKFIDDISVNAVETCLIQCLPDVFSPDVVWNLTDEEVELLGSENDTTVTERAELTHKLKTLEKALRDLDAFTGRVGTLRPRGSKGGPSGKNEKNLIGYY